MSITKEEDPHFTGRVDEGNADFDGCPVHSVSDACIDCGTCMKCSGTCYCYLDTGE